jgi:hypothetical protein
MASKSLQINGGARSQPVADPFVRQEQATHQMFAAIARKIEEDPALLSVPLDNIERWLAKGHPAERMLNAWKGKIELALRSPSDFQALLQLLRDPSPDAMRWKGYSPFAGVLTMAEIQMLA